MKKKIILATLFVATTISAYFVGTTQAETIVETETVTETVTETLEVIPDGYINTNSDDFRNDYINMNDVTDFEATETGLMLYTSDGSGYYWEK